MSEVLVFFLLLSAGLGALCYFVTESLYLSLGVGIFTILVLFFLVMPSIKKYSSLKTKQHESYLFINSFLITLSVSQSIEKSYELATENVEKDFKDTVHAISHLTPMQRVEYLSNYFEMPIYDMFLSVLTIYLEQGGDVLKLSKTLMEELTRIEETSMSLSKHAVNVLIQWIVLWAMSFAIMGFARFGLNSFYSYIKDSPTFLLMTLAYFLLLDISIVVFTIKYTGVLPWKTRILKIKQSKKGASI